MSAPIAPPLPSRIHNEHLQNIRLIKNAKEPFTYVCAWATDYPELQKACYCARICTQKSPEKCQYLKICSITQNGPTCGLVCISMLCGGKPTPQQLLGQAKALKYTNNGEMFSAQNLLQLICANLQSQTNSPKSKANNHDNDGNECQVLLHEGRLNCVKVKQYLQAGSCICVPYDPDCNHTPCLKNGHKAHWALIIGYLISDDNEFFVLTRHGKTRHIGVWSLEDLSDSNANLFEFSQPKLYPNCDFILPSGGIGGDLGLRERAIIVKGLPHELIKVK